MVHIHSTKCFECSNRPPAYSCLDCGEDVCVNCIVSHEGYHEEESEELERAQRRDTRNDSGV